LGFSRRQSQALAPIRYGNVTDWRAVLRDGEPISCARPALFEFSTYHVVLVAVGGAIVLSYWLPRFLSGREPAASALLIGFGLLAFGWIPKMPSTISPLAWPTAWETVSGMCVISGLFGVGLRIDKLRPLDKWRPTIRLLLIAMPLSIIAVAITGWLAGLTLAGALMLGAILAPTDPVLASDVQVGPPTEGDEHPLRFALTTEAGLNDGLAFPFLYLALSIASAGAINIEIISDWLWRDIGYRIAVGAGFGIGVGCLLGKIMFDWPSRNALAETGSGVVALAGVFLTYGITELAEGYGFIAVFVAAVTLRRVESGHEFHTSLHDFVESIERSLTALLLVALGASLPNLLAALNWQGAAIGFALIFFIRPIVGWLSLSGLLPQKRERAVMAFYGIRGIGSINYLAYAATHVDLINIEQLWAVVACAIVTSTIVHGFTAGLAVERATGEVSS
jgi:sodium/hydrogen antiporter